MIKFLTSLFILLGLNTTANAVDDISTEISISDSLIVEINQKIAGKYLHDYANTWWQWTKTMSKQDSPVIDRVGDKCHVNQNGDVWFLAGGYGTSKINRKCIIPEGKHIFFPIINMVYWPKKTSTSNCEKMKMKAALNNEQLLSINVELDGINIPEAHNYRIKSETCFDLYGLIPEEYNAPKIFPTATDGYWLMLKPLNKGLHTLKFSAQYKSINNALGKMAQDIEYEIIIQ